jgi:hypothetical protein
MQEPIAWMQDLIAWMQDPIAWMQHLLEKGICPDVKERLPALTVQTYISVIK